jgi:cobalt-zinc-cadmium efflux system outer membrane protein
MLGIALILVSPSLGLAQPQPAPQSRQTTASTPTLSLNDLIATSLARHPRLAQAGYAIQAAQGRALKAGLYPNPTIGVVLDEVGDRLGPGGTNTLPLVTQEIVTAKKLSLARAMANREKTQAELALTQRKYELVAEIRSTYFDVLAADRRVQILTDLVKLATQSYEQTETLLKAKRASELDLLQMRVELNRARAEQDAAEKERDAAWRRLAAVTGVPELLATRIDGSLDAPLPEYDIDVAQEYIIEAHPEVAAARVAVDRAELALRRARAGAIPNVTIGAGYVRQNQNQSNDWTPQVSMPFPLWNRNQGDKLAAQAEIGQAMQGVARVQLALSERLATAFGRYAPAKKRAERYRDSILPDSQKTYQLSLQAFQGGQFEYLRVLQAQRSLFEANLEYVRAAAEAWRGAAEISGLLLEDTWPPTNEKK